jgi:hypothetical protein
MTSASSSKKEEDLTFSFGDVGESPTLPVFMLSLLSLYEKCIDFVLWVTKSNWGQWARSCVGAFSCACVCVYVAGEACGYWFRRFCSSILIAFQTKND